MSQPISLSVAPPLRDDPRILELYVDSPAGINFVNGNLHLTFITVRSDHSTDSPTQHRQVTLRMVIPLAGAIDLHGGINGILGLLQSQGVIQPVMPGTPTRQ